MAEESSMALRPMNHRATTTATTTTTTTTATNTSTTTTATTTITATTTTATTTTTTSTGKDCPVHLSKGGACDCDVRLESACSFTGFEFDSRPARLINDLRRILVKTGSVPGKRSSKRSLSDVNGVVQNEESLNPTIPLSLSENVDAKGFTTLEKVIIEETNLENGGTKGFTSLGKVIIEETNLENAGTKEFTSLGNVIIEETNLEYTVKRQDNCVSVRQNSSGIENEEVSFLDKSCSEVEDLCFISLCGEGQEEDREEPSDIIILKELLRDKSSFLNNTSIMTVSCIKEEEADPIESEEEIHAAIEDHEETKQETENHLKKTEDHNPSRNQLEAKNSQSAEDHKTTENYERREEDHKQTENSKEREEDHLIKKDSNQAENHKPTENHKKRKNHSETKGQRQAMENHERRKNEKETKENCKTQNHKKSNKEMAESKEIENHKETKKDHQEMVDKKTKDHIQDHKETEDPMQTELAKSPFDSQNPSPVVVTMQQSDCNDIYTLDQLVEVEQVGQYHLYGAPEYIEEVITVEDAADSPEEHQNTQPYPVSFIAMDHSYSLLPVRWLQDAFTPTEKERSPMVEFCEIETEELVSEEQILEMQPCETEDQEMDLGDSRAPEGSDMKDQEAKRPSLGESELVSSSYGNRTGSEDSQKDEEVESSSVGESQSASSHESNRKVSEDPQKDQETENSCVGESESHQNENTGSEDSQKGQEAGNSCVGEPEALSPHQSAKIESKESQKDQEAKSPGVKGSKAASTHQSDRIVSEIPCLGKPESVSSHMSERDARNVSDFGTTTTHVHIPVTSSPASSPSDSWKNTVSAAQASNGTVVSTTNTISSIACPLEAAPAMSLRSSPVKSGFRVAVRTTRSNRDAKDITNTANSNTSAVSPPEATSTSLQSGGVGDGFKSANRATRSSNAAKSPTIIIRYAGASSPMSLRSSPTSDGPKSATRATRSNRDSKDVMNNTNTSSPITRRQEAANSLSLRSGTVVEDLKNTNRATRSNKDTKDTTNSVNKVSPVARHQATTNNLSLRSGAGTEDLKNTSRATRNNKDTKDTTNSTSKTSPVTRHQGSTDNLSLQSGAIIEDLKTVLHATKSNKDGKDLANSPVTCSQETTDNVSLRSGTIIEVLKNAIRVAKNKKRARSTTSITNVTDGVACPPETTSARSLPSSPVTVRSTRSNSDVRDLIDVANTTPTARRRSATNPLSFRSGAVAESCKRSVFPTTSNDGVANVLSTSTTTAIVHSPKINTNSILSPKATTTLSSPIKDNPKKAFPDTTSNGIQYPLVISPAVHSSIDVMARKGLQSDHSVLCPTQSDTDIPSTQKGTQEGLDSCREVLDCDKMALDSDRVVMDSEEILTSESLESNQNHSCDCSALGSEPFRDPQTGSSKRLSCSNRKCCSCHSSSEGRRKERQEKVILETQRARSQERAKIRITRQSYSNDELPKLTATEGSIIIPDEESKTINGSDIHENQRDESQEKAKTRTTRQSYSNDKLPQLRAIEGSVTSLEEEQNAEEIDRLSSEGQRAGSQERTTIRSSIQLRKRKIFKLIEVPQRESFNYDMISNLDSFYTNDTSSPGDSGTKDKWVEALPDLFPSSKAEKRAINRIWQVLTTQLENCMKGVATLPPPVCMRSKKRKRSARGRRRGRGEESKSVTPQTKNINTVSENLRPVPEIPDSRVTENSEAKKASDPLSCSEKVLVPKRKSVCFCHYNTVLPLASRRTCCGRKRFKSGCRHSSRTSTSSSSSSSSSREDMAYPTDKGMFFSNLGLMEKSQYDTDVYYKSLVTHRTRKVRAHQNKGKAHYRMFLNNSRGFIINQNAAKLKQPLPLKFISEHKLCKLSKKEKMDVKVRALDWLIDDCVTEHNFKGFHKAVTSKTGCTRKELSLQESPARIGGLESLPSHSEALPPLPFCCTDTNDNFTENFNLPKISGQSQSPLKASLSDVEKCSVCEKSSDGLCSKNCSLRKEVRESLPLQANTSDGEKCSVCQKSSDGSCSESCKAWKKSKELLLSLKTNTSEMEKCTVCENTSDGLCSESCKLQRKSKELLLSSKSKASDTKQCIACDKLSGVMCSMEHKTHIGATTARACELHAKAEQGSLVTQEEEVRSLRRGRRVECTKAGEDDELGSFRRVRIVEHPEVGNEGEVDGKDSRVRNGRKGEFTAEADSNFSASKRRKLDNGLDAKGEDLKLGRRKQGKCATDVSKEDLRVRKGRKEECTLEFEKENVSVRGEETVKCIAGDGDKDLNVRKEKLIENEVDKGNLGIRKGRKEELTSEFEKKNHNLNKGKMVECGMEADNRDLNLAKEGKGECEVKADNRDSKLRKGRKGECTVEFENDRREERTIESVMETDDRYLRKEKEGECEVEADREDLRTRKRRKEECTLEFESDGREEKTTGSGMEANNRDVTMRKEKEGESNVESHMEDLEMRKGRTEESAMEFEEQDLNAREEETVESAISDYDVDSNLRKEKEGEDNVETGREDLKVRKGRKGGFTMEFDNEKCTQREGNPAESEVEASNKDFNSNRKSSESMVSFESKDFRLLDTYTISEEEFSSLEEDSSMEETDVHVSIIAPNKDLSLKMTDLDGHNDDSSNSSLPDLWSIGNKPVTSIHHALSTIVESPPQSDDSPMGSAVTLEHLRGLPVQFDEESEDCDFLGFDSKANQLCYDTVSPPCARVQGENAVSPKVDITDELAESCKYYEPQKPVDGPGLAAITPKMPPGKINSSKLNMENLDSEKEVEIKLPKRSLMDFTTWGLNNEMMRNSIVDFELRPEDLELETKNITQPSPEEMKALKLPTLPEIMSPPKKESLTTVPAIVDFELRPEDLELETKGKTRLSLKGMKDLKLTPSPTPTSPPKKENRKALTPEIDLMRSCRVSLTKIQIPESGLDGIKIGVEGSLGSLILSPKKLTKGVKESDRESETSFNLSGSCEDSIDSPVFSDTNLSPSKLIKNIKKNEQETESCVPLSKSPEDGSGSLKEIKKDECQPETSIAVPRTSKRQNVRRIKYSKLLKPGMRRSLNGLCRKDHPTLAYTTRHARSASDGLLIKCTTCSLPFRSKFALSMHQATHKAQREYKCAHCGLKVRSKASLTIHLETHKVMKEITCVHCGLKIRSKAALAIHMATHKVLKEYKCAHCGLKLQSKAALNIHLDAHKVEFKCSQCSFKFRSMATLSMHMEMHKAPKEYECDQCGIKLRSKVALNQHLDAHKAPREYECLECGLTFTEKANFESHVRLHSSARQLVSCERCGVCFSQLEDLRSHVKSHLSPNSQDCDVTSKYETSVGDALHIDIKEGGGECVPCSGTFVVSPTLRRHSRMFGRGKEHHCALCKVDGSSQGN